MLLSIIFFCYLLCSDHGSSCSEQAYDGTVLSDDERSQSVIEPTKKSKRRKSQDKVSIYSSEDDSRDSTSSTNSSKKSSQACHTQSKTFVDSDSDASDQTNNEKNKRPDYDEQVTQPPPPPSPEVSKAKTNVGVGCRAKAKYRTEHYPSENTNVSRNKIEVQHSEKEGLVEDMYSSRQFLQRRSVSHPSTSTTGTESTGYGSENQWEFDEKYGFVSRNISPSHSSAVNQDNTVKDAQRIHKAKPNSAALTGNGNQTHTYDRHTIEDANSQRSSRQNSENNKKVVCTSATEQVKLNMQEHHTSKICQNSLPNRDGVAYASQYQSANTCGSYQVVRHNSHVGPEGERNMHNMVQEPGNHPTMGQIHVLSHGYHHYQPCFNQFPPQASQPYRSGLTSSTEGNTSTMVDSESSNNCYFQPYEVIRPAYNPHNSYSGGHHHIQYPYISSQNPENSN